MHEHMFGCEPFASAERSISGSRAAPAIMRSQASRVFHEEPSNTGERTHNGDPNPRVDGDPRTPPLTRTYSASTSATGVSRRAERP